MKIHTAIIAAALFALATPACAIDWANYTYANYGFSADFPVKHEAEQIELAPAEKDLIASMTDYTAHLPKGFYKVSIVRRHVPVSLERAANFMRRVYSCTSFTVDQTVTTANGEAHEFRGTGCEPTGDYAVMSRIYVRDDLIYEVAYRGQQDIPNEGERFIGSFKLTQQ